MIPRTSWPHAAGQEALAIIDIYSRYTVGWMVATRESAQLAERLLLDTIAKQNINLDQLTIHSDNGSSLASRPVAFLLADLGVTKSHSRSPDTSTNTYRHEQSLVSRIDVPHRGNRPLAPIGP